MTQQQYIIRRKLNLLELGSQLRVVVSRAVKRQLGSLAAQRLGKGKRKIIIRCDCFILYQNTASHIPSPHHVYQNNNNYILFHKEVFSQAGSLLF